MSEIKSNVEKLVQKELESANQKFPAFHSDYEGAAVIFSEMQNMLDKIAHTEDVFKRIWSFTIHDSYSEEITSDLKSFAIDISCSAIQVAAMAQKFIDSQKERENQK